MDVRPITDPGLVVETVNTQGIKEVVFEPGTAPDLDVIQGLINTPENSIFLGVYSSRFLGLFFFHKKSAVTWQGHQCILPGCRGKEAYQGGYLALKWLFDNTNCLKIQGETPVDLPHARRFVKRLGFRDEGVLRSSFVRGNSVIDQWLLGLKKEELK